MKTQGRMFRGNGFLVLFSGLRKMFQLISRILRVVNTKLHRIEPIFRILHRAFYLTRETNNLSPFQELANESLQAEGIYVTSLNQFLSETEIAELLKWVDDRYQDRPRNSKVKLNSWSILKEGTSLRRGSTSIIKIHCIGWLFMSMSAELPRFIFDQRQNFAMWN